MTSSMLDDCSNKVRDGKLGYRLTGEGLSEPNSLEHHSQAYRHDGKKTIEWKESIYEMLSVYWVGSGKHGIAGRNYLPRWP